MTYDTYRFTLGRQKTICPRCGHRDFKPYIDMATGEPLDVNVCGRCNRENSCRYHLRPFCRSVRVIDVSLPPYILIGSEYIGDWLLRCGGGSQPSR